MAYSSICLFIFFAFFLGDLEASQHIHRNLQSSSHSQPYQTGYHFQPPFHSNLLYIVNRIFLFMSLTFVLDSCSDCGMDKWVFGYADPNGPMIYKGIYHLFYQYNLWGHLVWGHSTSTDMVNWTPHDSAIYPSQPYDSNGCWSGSVTILSGGNPVILYTGIDSGNKQVQNLAVPKNLSDPYLKEWIKIPENPLMVPPDQIDSDSFRDPTTAWLGPDRIWRVIIGSKINDTGLAILYRSKDFVNWTKAEQSLYSTNQSGMWECPDFFPVSTNSLKGVDTSVIGPNIKHVLKASVSKKQQDYYAIGRYNSTTDTYIVEEGSLDGNSGLRYDYGKFYASKTFFDNAKNRRILWGWINESSGPGDDLKNGWSGLQAIPRNLWLDKSGKQLVQWPVAEINKLRANQVKWPAKLLEGGSMVEVTGITATQADIEISFQTTDFEKAEVLDSIWTNPQFLCSQKGASVNGALGPFGLLVLASNGLQEYTALFFRIFKGQDKHVVLMCSDQSRSSLDADNDKTSYGAFLDVDPVHEKLSIRSLIDRSIVESFGGGGKACITARVYPTLAIDNKAHLYAFNNGTEKVNITSLRAWSMKKAQIN